MSTSLPRSSSTARPRGPSEEPLDETELDAPSDDGLEAPVAAPVALEVRGLSAFFGATRALSAMSLEVLRGEVLAVIGPSSSGKSTLLRCLNRMHELAPRARVEGEVRLSGVDVYGPSVDPVRVRRAIGLVVQRPNPFPTLSIGDNVLAGLRLSGLRAPRPSELVERHLRDAGLWVEVKDRLAAPAGSLSIGQQQRLCFARLLAVEPEVVLLDEPCAMLDPVATARIEELVIELKERLTLVLVTHNMQQAARVSDRTAFIQAGALVEIGPTGRIFTNPRETSTEDYVTGKFG